MASAWIPKATVQAALSYTVIAMTDKTKDTMTPKQIEDYSRYGLVVLTTAVFTVILSAPAGAILVNSLGKKLLTYDGDPNDMTKSDFAFKYGKDGEKLDEVEKNKVSPDETKAEPSKENNGE